QGLRIELSFPVSVARHLLVVGRRLERHRIDRIATDRNQLRAHSHERHESIWQRCRGHRCRFWCRCFFLPKQSAQCATQRAANAWRRLLPTGGLHLLTILALRPADAESEAESDRI